MISRVALLLSGAYSVTAALGSAGGRANATATEKATTDTRTGFVRMETPTR